MKMDIRLDITEFLTAAGRARVTSSDLKKIETPGALVLVNGMRERVPVDTSATKNSIASHYDVELDDVLVDQVGPETEYGPYLEYGTGEYAEGGNGRKGGWVYKGRNGFFHTMGSHPQPFVRPTVEAEEDTCIRAISEAMRSYLEDEWVG